MEIVGAYACSHAGLISTRRDSAPAPQRDAVFRAYAAVRHEIARLAPDAIVIVATDHLRAWPFSGVPAFAIGVGPVARGLGDAGIKPCEIAIHQPLAQAILVGAVERHVDFVFSEDVSIDHSFAMPLWELTPGFDVPIVPITQNCNVAPRPTFRRSYEVGKVLGEAIGAGPPGRAVIIGTGGLSHWVGSEARQSFMRRPAGTRLAELASHPVEIDDVGDINADFDRAFLDMLGRGGAATFAAHQSPDEVEAVAGNGAQEIRNWLTTAAAVGDAPTEILAYEPVAEWLTGTSVVRFRVE